jgi:hypothetical protein
MQDSLAYMRRMFVAQYLVGSFEGKEFVPPEYERKRLRDKVACYCKWHLEHLKKIKLNNIPL